jgi:hypothetical protein
MQQKSLSSAAFIRRLRIAGSLLCIQQEPENAIGYGNVFLPGTVATWNEISVLQIGISKHQKVECKRFRKTNGGLLVNDQKTGLPSF